MGSVPALRVCNLKKTYPGAVEALKGVSLAVATGDFFALLGPNGAGKSTLIGIVSSLVNKTDGLVEVFGTDMAADSARAKAAIGIVPQEVNFNPWEPPLDVVVNQAGYYGIRRSEAVVHARELLERLKLWEHHDRPARQLSGGMKRRLMIARSLVHGPRLLILDEPTAGVDIEIRRSMWTFLEELNAAGTTIILTTHYLEEAESLCKNIAIIDDGEIVENTSMKALLAKLKRETFVLDLASDLERPPRIEGFLSELKDAHTLEVQVAQGQVINLVFDQLSRQGIAVRSMRNKANRLEELFLKLIEQNDIAGHATQLGSHGQPEEGMAASG